MLDSLKTLEGCLVRGVYGIVVGGAPKSENTVYREGVDPGAFQGTVAAAKVTKAGNTVLTVRTVNRITAGDRKATTEAMIDAADADPRAFKGLPGEFQFRTYRLEGIQKLEVCRGSKWFPVTLPHVQFLELAAAISQAAMIPADAAEQAAQ